ADAINVSAPVRRTPEAGSGTRVHITATWELSARDAVPTISPFSAIDSALEDTRVGSRACTNEWRSIPLAAVPFQTNAWLTLSVAGPRAEPTWYVPKTSKASDRV